MFEVVVWNGWLGGLLIGLYVIAQVYLTGEAVGVSTGFGHICRVVFRNLHLHKMFSASGDWRIYFIIGLPIGGLIAVITSPHGSWTPTFAMGTMYDQLFQNSLWIKGIILTLGGVLLGYGARLAGGCTSGHSIMGISLLNPPSLIASIAFFVGGIFSVQLAFRLFVF
jgi:hypothetical protein